ncbi:MAG: hypothetical protein JWM16_4483 [Verrucomicrobiales bacterium]|nr:hypothetical protein [Verrucomicrobiales bacterium]
MTTRLYKEIRVQMLPFGLVICSALLPGLGLPDKGLPYMFPLFALAASMMAAVAFGHEFQHRTMQNLLVQPLPRMVLWREKVLVMGGLLLVGSLCVWRSMRQIDGGRLSLDDDFFWPLVLIPLCAFCGGPLWTLLLRSNLMGVIIGILAPVALLVIQAIVADRLSYSPDSQSRNAVVLLLVYCGSCFVAGFRRFRTIEALDGAPSARELGIPSWVESLLSKPSKALFGKSSGPFVALLKKELRLQQITFLGAALFFGVALAAIALKRGRLDFNQNVGFFEMTLILIFFLFIFLMPMMTGTLAVAEEKTWGVADWHFTLPPSAGRQWLAKMLIVYSTSVVLGLVLPAMLAWFMGALPPDFLQEELVVWIFCMHVLVVSTIVYASVWSTSTLRSIILAIGIFIGLGCLIRLAVFVGIEYRGGVGPLIQVFAADSRTQSNILEAIGLGSLFLLAVVFQVLAFRVFLKRALGWRQFAAQGLILMVLVFAVGALLGLLSIR